jgi:transposase-like protein
MSFRFHGILCPGCRVSWNLKEIHPPITEAEGAIMDMEGITPVAHARYGCPRCGFSVVAVFTEERCEKAAGGAMT